jgi:hypothetical protein
MAEALSLKKTHLIILVATLSPLALAAEKGRVPGRYQPGRAGTDTIGLESRGGVRADALEAMSSFPADRYLTPQPVSGLNPLEAYLPGDVHPRALEAVGIRLAMREAARRWKRLAEASLQERFDADPSYSILDFGKDRQKLRRAARECEWEPDGTLRVFPYRRGKPITLRNDPLMRTRFFSVGQDLRLRMNLQEVVGIIIGEGPEDEYCFDNPEGPLSGENDYPDLPRVQIRGRARLHLDQGFVTGRTPLEDAFSRFGGQVSVTLLSPGRSEKIVTAFLETSWRREGEPEMAFGINRRF